MGWERTWRIISAGRAGRGGAGRERQKRAVRLEARVVQFSSGNEGESTVGVLVVLEEGAILASQ